MNTDINNIYIISVYMIHNVHAYTRGKMDQFL
jgi:hypothetical protein